MRVSRLVPLALIAVVATACTASKAATPVAQDPAATPATRTITATGTGMAEGTPDLLTVTIGVQTQAPRATAALADNNTKTAAVIAALKGGGVADKDLQTSQLSISPTYAINSPVITGYQVSNMVTAKLRKLSGAGALIDVAASAAGDAVRIDGISFSIADDSALLTAARASAVRQAQARVRAMADAAGATLGRIRSVNDVSVQQPTPLMQKFAASAPTAGAVPLQAGSQQVSIDVQVVYDIAS